MMPNSADHEIEILVKSFEFCVYKKRELIVFEKSVRLLWFLAGGLALGHLFFGWFARHIDAPLVQKLSLGTSSTLLALTIVTLLIALYLRWTPHKRNYVKFNSATKTLEIEKQKLSFNQIVSLQQYEFNGAFLMLKVLLDNGKEFPLLTLGKKSKVQIDLVEKTLKKILQDSQAPASQSQFQQDQSLRNSPKTDLVYETKKLSLSIVLGLGVAWSLLAWFFFPDIYLQSSHDGSLQVPLWTLGPAMIVGFLIKGSSKL